MPDDTMRSTIEAAFDQHNDDAQPTPESTAGDIAPPASTDEAAPPSTQPPAESSEPPSVGERVRDALGRFTKPDQVDGKGQVAPQPVARPGGAVGQPQAPIQPAPLPPDMPPSLPPLLREAWPALPDNFKQYTLQREQQVAQAMSVSAHARQFANTFMQTVTPYADAIKAEGNGNPIQAIDALLETASTLRFGTPYEKAKRVAQLVNYYGVDIATLDGALVGIQPPQQNGFDPSMVERAVDQRLAPILQRAQAYHAQQEQRVQHEVQTELQSFAADRTHEFFGDVRGLMADIIEVGDRNGMEINVADAYQRACLLHPEVSKIMLARQQGQSAQHLTQAAQRARSAAVSIKGAAPVGNPNPTEPSSIRDAIEAAIESHSRV